MPDLIRYLIQARDPGSGPGWQCGSGSSTPR